MRITSLLLPFVARGSAGSANQEPMDAKPSIPPVLSPVLRLPFPQLAQFSAVQGNLAPTYSWIHSERYLFNASNNTSIIVIGPGIWSVYTRLNIIEQGAISDATSSSELRYNTIGTGQPAISVGFITNKQGVVQNQETTIEFNIDELTMIQWTRVNVVGLGTGLNLAQLIIRATRYL